MAQGNPFDDIFTPPSGTSELLGIPLHILDSSEWADVAPPSPVLSSGSPEVKRRKTESEITCLAPQSIEIGTPNLVDDYLADQADNVLSMFGPSEVSRIIEGLLENLRFKISKTQWTRDLHEFTSDFSCPQELVSEVRAIFEGKRGFKYTATSQYRPCWAIVSFISEMFLISIIARTFSL